MSAYNFRVNDIKFDDNTVIELCKFSIEKGQLAALIGPSGCGKTTMLNIIAGLRTFAHIPSKPIQNLSYIFQEPRLIPWLTINQNLQLVNPKLSDEQCDELLAQVDLHDNGDVFPNHLSGGMQKRVSIARAFAKPPSLLLLDEPFSSLDQPTAHALHELLLKLLEKHQTAAILVTHDLSEAIALADDIYFLSSHPMNIIHRHSISVSKTERTTDVIQSIVNSLHTNNPSILKGKA